jgi:sugar/nucleoside kinase (ribokinase family)
MRGSILTVGDSTVDHFLSVNDREAELVCRLKHKECEVCFDYGEKIPIESLSDSFGGSALNCAVGFQKLAIDSSVSTFIGDDIEGKAILDYLKENKVGTANVKTDQTTNQATVLLYKNERTILSYHKPRDYSLLKIDQSPWIYLASAGHGSDKLKKRILELVASGSNIIFNPGSWELNNFDKFESIIKHCSIVILNRDEARLAVEDTQDVKKQLDKIIKLGAKIAVITDGAAGAYISFLGNYFHQNSMMVKVVDTTGAGDAFAVGFCGGLILGHSIEESAKWGIINSSSVIETLGANAGQLDINEIEKRLKSFKILKFERI